MHTFMNVMQILTTRSIHSYRLAAVHLTVAPKRNYRNYFMKKKAIHVLVSFTDTQHFSWSMNSIHLLYNITYERIKDKAYRGILAVVRLKTKGTKKLLKLSV